MSQPVTANILQFLNWIADRPRTYAEVMDAWRSTCPRLTIWEDSLAAGYVQLDDDGASARDSPVSLTPLGRSVLQAAPAA